MSIEALLEIREDGREVSSTMTGLEMLQQGWGPSRIKKVRWISNGQEHTYRSPYGLSACIVPGAEFVAIVQYADMQQKVSLLHLVSADGHRQLTVPNEQSIHGRVISGSFAWFSDPVAAGPNVLGIVFRPPKESDAYLLQINAATGNTISAEYIRV